jgi:hypothetical protein
MSINSPQQAAPKKGMSPLAWVGIGCGVIVVIAVIGFGIMGYLAKKQFDKFSDNPTMAAAELAIKIHPDYEMVSKDEDASTLTIKDVKTGEVMTLDAENIKNGEFKVTTKDGTVTMDADGGEEGGSLTVTGDNGEKATFQGGAGAAENRPSWVPVYPGGTTEGAFEATTDTERSAAFTMTTQDSVAKVMEYYETQLKAAGFTTQKASFEAEGKTSGTVSGTTADQKRTVSAMITTGDQGGTQATVSFVEKK